MKRLVLACVLFVVSGCAARSGALRARFARDVGCDETAVSVSPDGNTRYTARGCDRSITYVCQSGTGASADDCSEARDQPGTAGPPPMRTNIPGTDPAMQQP